MRPPSGLLRLLRDAGKAAAARRTASAAACAQSRALQAAQAASAATRDTGDASGSAAGWWAVAGAGVLLGQSLRTAHAEEQRPPEASASGAAPPELVSNKSTAQWRLYTNMGHEHFRKGDVDRAKRYLVRALEEARRGFGEADGHVAAACNNLAELYRNAGSPAKAEPLYLESLRILEAAYGSRDPRTAQALQHLAGFYRQQGRFGQARRHYRLSLQAVEGSLGAQHPAYAAGLLQLADLERATDDMPQAAALLRQALAVLDALGPPSAEDALQAANRLGQVLVLSGQHTEGLAVLRRCVQQAESVAEQPASDGSGSSGGSSQGGRGQALLLLHVGSLAEALLRSGDLEGARDCFHRALSLGSGEGPRRALLPGLLLSCAEAELRLGDATQRRDSWLRAHNLALQATEQLGGRWRRLAAAKARGGKAGPGWWERLLGSEPDPEAAAVEASPATVALCHQWARAHALLARVQERLGRLPEARQALGQALAVLQRPAAVPAKAHAGQPLDAATGAREPWVQAQILHLQLLVEVLYNLLRLTADDGAAQQLPGVRAALAELGARLPGLTEGSSGAAGPPGVEGLTPLGCRAWAARQRLNALQGEINGLRRREAAAESAREQ